MTRFVAFLRAINVGGHVVKMDRLRELFESLGFTNVETYIASGNVVFDSTVRNGAGLESKIATHLEAALGYEVATFVRTTAELGEVARHEPFPKRDAATLYVGFLARPLTKEQERAVLAFRTPVDNFAFRGRELYWSCSVKSMESEFSLARLERALKIRATIRNANTVRKMAERYAE